MHHISVVNFALCGGGCHPVMIAVQLPSVCVLVAPHTATESESEYPTRHDRLVDCSSVEVELEQGFQVSTRLLVRLTP